MTATTWDAVVALASHPFVAVVTGIVLGAIIVAWYYDQ